MHARSSAPSRLVASLLALMLTAAAGPVAAGPVDAKENRPILSQQVSAPAGRLDATVAAPPGLSGRHHFVLEMADTPAAVLFAAQRAKSLGVAVAGQSAREQSIRVTKAQTALKEALAASKIDAQVIYQLRQVYNGVVVQADAKEVSRLAKLPGVAAVRYLPLQQLDHTATMPLIGATQAWSSYGLTGQGIRVGVIDTGIDYLHTMFGGNGNYQANDTLRIGDTPGFFPGSKVVGGYDFVGDHYNASSTDPAAYTPAPDPDPMDCPRVLGGGHGSHVAGTVGGFGVNADGSTYTGAYDSSLQLDSMRIGPGVAPHAELYALRVFGCTGSTAVTALALEWATDPNGDGDPSDHLDVVNLSLGSSYGTPDDPTAVAANNAAAAGVVVVASAGNSNDLYYITGSPASATRALSVASSVDKLDVTDGFRVDSPAPVAGIYPSSHSQSFNWLGMATPVSGPVVYVPSNPAGCSAFAPGSLTGQILLVDWIPTGQTTFPCGSALRANNATAAGAIGVIMANNKPYIDTAIAGNAAIPATFTTSTAGDAIKSGLASGPVSATLDKQWIANQNLITPGLEDTISSFTSRGPRGRDNHLKPDIAAPGQSIFSAQAGTYNLGLNISGTSMAAPHMAGVMTLLRQAHPSWTVEELKALAMNTAHHDLFTGQNRTGLPYGPQRVGAGRVDAPSALEADVIAYSAEEEGAVSLSFGSVEVVGSTLLSRTVKVANKGDQPVTYTARYVPRSTVPGVHIFIVGGYQLTVEPGETASFQVLLSAQASRMKYTRDATYAWTGGQWIPEVSGLVMLEPAVGQSLRVPVYATARPASAMTGSPENGFIGLSGHELNASGGGTWPDLLSTVTSLELMYSSGLADLTGLAGSARGADLQYVGIATDSQAVLAGGQPITNASLWFGIATHGDWSVPASEVTFYIDIDTNGDSVADRFVANVTAGDFYYSGLYVGGANQAVRPLNGFSSALPTYPFNSNIMLLPVPASWLGLPGGTTQFQYRIAAVDRFSDLIEETPWLSYDYAHPGVSFGTAPGMPMWADRDGYSIPFTIHQADWDAHGAQGILLFHHHNAAENRTQVIQP